MKKIHIILCIYFLLFRINLYAAFSELFSGARPMALGGSFAALADDLNSIYYNPAGLSSLKGFSFSGTWLRYYNLEELQNIIASFGMPWMFGGLGISYQMYGFDLYKETQIIWSHGFPVSSRLQLGYNIKYLNLSLNPDPQIIPMIKYGSETFISFDLGVRGNIDTRLSLGAFAMDINTPKMGKSNPEGSEQKFSLSLGYRPFHEVFTTMSLDKNSGESYKVRAGVELGLSQFLDIRTGLQSKPFYFSVGTGVYYQLFHFDYALVNNFMLGQTHIVSLSLIFGQNDEQMRTIQSGSNYYTGPKININTANVKELSDLPCIGSKMAEKIIQYRINYGLFESIEDLKKVKGIGDEIFNHLKEHITIGEIQPMRNIEKFDINTAQLKDFVDRGISPLKGIKIIKYREEKGGIKDIKELKNIEGITQEDIQKLKALMEGE